LCRVSSYSVPVLPRPTINRMLLLCSINEKARGR
jgi:hypothetical protein